MSNLLAGAVAVLIATNQPVAISNFIHARSGIEIPITATNDPVELELRQIMIKDDAAEAEVDRWIRENEEFRAKGAGVSSKELNRRIMDRLQPVRTAYENFLRQHTNSASAHVAFASFLNDIGEEEAQCEHLETARGLDPKDPAIWNNLANFYGHSGPVTNAFVYYAKAIELDGAEPVYYHNFGTTVFLFRKDAKEFYNINEQQVFDKALVLYSNAMRLAPTDFPLASDVAQTYYGIQPPRTEAALRAWTNAFKLANDDIEREGVHTHFARVKMHVGRFEEARAHLGSVTNKMYADLKQVLTRALQDEVAKRAGTNLPAAEISIPSTNAPTETK